MSATIREIVDEALTVIGEVSGAGVNAYSEDRMMSDTIRAFNLLFKKYDWPQYMAWFRFQLDGATGVIITDGFDHVKDFEDFKAVFRDGSDCEISKLSPAVNPYKDNGQSNLFAWDSLPATDAKYEKRRLQFWPKTSTEFVNVRARVYPIANDEEFDWDDKLYLDKDMLVAGVAYMTLSSDDMNSGAADAQKNMMEIRYRDIIAELGSQKVAIRTGSSIPTNWQVSN